MPALLQAFLRLVALKRLGVLLFVLAAMLCAASTASAFEHPQTKTRVWGFDFAEDNSYGLFRAATRGKHQGNRVAQSEVASGSLLAAEGGFTAIGSTGRVGEQALEQLGGESQVFFRTSEGGRFVDQLVDGVAHESKVGYQSLTSTIGRQIGKDAELLQTGQVNGYTWHFFESPVTGLGGPSATLREALGRAGIDIVVH